MKILAWYLPQFHETPENNEWWGEGFTEWTNVKKAVQLYPDQYQPRIPLNNNYYNLLNKDTIQWQANIAKKYGIYGFCFYHYWFTGKHLLEKPIKILLDNTDIHMPFCICWTNEKWTNIWKDGTPTILMDQNYGDKELWEKHFTYFLPFFKDSRYIKENNKPLLGIYEPKEIPCLKPMIEYWQERARQEGFSGLTMFYKSGDTNADMQHKELFTYDVFQQPSNALSYSLQEQHKGVWQIRKKMPKWVFRVFAKPLFYVRERFLDKWGSERQGYLYEEIWKQVVSNNPTCPTTIPVAFSDWDNTSRKGKRGTYLSNPNPEIFKKYFEKLVIKAKRVYKKDWMFFFAWNEWAESGYLEPDEKFGYRYLESIREVLIKLNEFPAPGPKE